LKPHLPGLIAGQVWDYLLQKPIPVYLVVKFGWNRSLVTDRALYFTIPYKKAVSDFKNIPVPEQKIDYNNSTHILIAEDEDSNYMVLEEWLSELSIENTRAYNGFEAVKLCHENKAIRVVLMDIKMPVMDGIEATKK
jgi:PleD family two-component response regulator